LIDPCGCATIAGTSGSLTECARHDICCFGNGSKCLTYRPISILNIYLTAKTRVRVKYGAVLGRSLRLPDIPGARGRTDGKCQEHRLRAGLNEPVTHVQPSGKVQGKVLPNNVDAENKGVAKVSWASLAAGFAGLNEGVTLAPATRDVSDWQFL
jgi:hypothetical protein